jgi:hypothetical protein
MSLLCCWSILGFPVTAVRSMRPCLWSCGRNMQQSDTYITKGYLTNFLTSPMGIVLGNIFRDSSEIAPILCSPKVHYRIHTCHTAIRSIPRFPTRFNIHFNVILPSVPRSSKWALSCRASHQTPVCVFPLPLNQILVLRPTCVRKKGGCK